MKRTSLLTSVAAVLALAAGTVSANDAYIKQIGNFNDNTINQSGSNQAAGTAAQPLLQDGNYNDMDITQSGGNNTLGYAEQLDNGNELSLDMISPSTDPQQNQSIDTISQDGASESDQVVNKAVIMMNNSGWTGNNSSSITSVTQEYLVEGEETGMNNINITMKRKKNRIGTVSQSGAGNDLDIVIDGIYSDLDTANQDGDGNTASYTAAGHGYSNDSSELSQTGDDNIANVSITGSHTNSNGYDLDGDARDVGLSLQSGVYTQSGTFNEMYLTVDGDRNEVGANQSDDLNYADIEVFGDYNQFAASQINGENSITGKSDGLDNQVAVSQTGGSVATFSQVGNNNNIGISQ